MKKFNFILLAATMIVGLSTVSASTENEEKCGNFEINCGNGNRMTGTICGDSHEANIKDLLNVVNVICS